MEAATKGILGAVAAAVAWGTQQLNAQGDIGVLDALEVDWANAPRFETTDGKVTVLADANERGTQPLRLKVAWRGIPPKPKLEDA